VAVPAGAEIAIYAARAKTHERRFILGFTERIWTAAFTETFSADLSFANWQTSSWDGTSITVSGGRGLIQAYGGPPREQIITRENAIPTDPDLAFKITIVAAFPEADPVYSQVITVLGVEQTFGVDGDPLKIIQSGSADVAGAEIGRIAMQSGGSVINDIAYTSADVTYEVLWDPNASGGAGDEKLTIKRDGVTLLETSDDGFAVQPRAVQIGSIRGVTTYIGGTAPTPADVDKPAFALGTPTVPVPTISVDSVTIEEDGDGYETASYPAFTSANAGGSVTGGNWSTLTAVSGERFTEGGVTWAEIPSGQIKSATWGVSRRGVIRASLVLSVGMDNGTDLTSELRWLGRTLLIDSRVKNDAGTATAWKRIGVYTVEEAKESDNGINLSAIDRASDRLDVPAARSYIGVEPDADAEGTLEATNIGFNFDEIVEDFINVGDAIKGGLLATTDHKINMPAIIPNVYDTGGASLLTAATGIFDRLVQQMWTRTRISGWGTYGGLMVNVWDFGTGTSGWTFYGRGGVANSTIAAPGVDAARNARGPSQVFYRQNNPLLTGELYTTTNLPLAGTFPSAPYPPGGRELNDSLALVANDAFSVLQPFPSDEDDAIDRVGGVAYLRWWQETLVRRRISFRVYGHDWMEPGDEIAIDDPLGRGLTTAETWVIDAVSYALDGSAIAANIEATTSDLGLAITSTI
jgi:hypothetical protein